MRRDDDESAKVVEIMAARYDAGRDIWTGDELSEDDRREWEKDNGVTR